MHARISGGIVQEVVSFNPADRFAPEIAALFVTAPNGTQAGARDNGDGTFTAPPSVALAAIVAPPYVPSAEQLDPNDFTFEDLTLWPS